MKFNVSSFLTNKLVLNVIAFLAMFNVIGYLVMGNLNVVVYFIIIAILIRLFSKNMSIVLGIPLIIVNLLAVGGNIEGMETKNKNGDSNTSIANTNSTPNTITSFSKEKSQENINHMINNNTSETTSTINNTIASTFSTMPDNAAQSAGEQQGFETGRRKNKGYNIDSATKIEDAYNEMNDILGNENIQNK